MARRPRPDVSVVIPTKDRWPLVRRAVDCALDQRDVEVEVIVVDDGSGDGTAAWLAALGEPRLRVQRNERPRGPAAARNLALASARGPWTAFLDDDDLWAPRKLRAQLDAAAAAAASFAFGDALVVDETLAPTGYDASPETDGLLVDLLKHNSVPGGCSNVVARTDLLRRLGGFDERLAVLADWDLWIRLAEAGRGARVAAPLVAYVEHARGLHVRSARGGIDELEYMRRKHRDLWARHDVDMGGHAWFPLWFAAAVRSNGETATAVRLYLEIALRFRSPGALARALVAPFTARVARHDLGSSRRDPGPPPVWLSEARRRGPA
jgi:glycosyltransferase involved in cell wall biosynthesis